MATQDNNVDSTDKTKKSESGETQKQKEPEKPKKPALINLKESLIGTVLDSGKKSE